MKKKLTKEEKQAKAERREKLKELLGGACDLDGVNTLVTDLRKEIIELMYDEELKNHLGFSKNDSRPEGSDNYRNGSYEKSVKTSTGELELSVPRDRNSEFEPQIVKKHQTDIFGIEDKIGTVNKPGFSENFLEDSTRRTASVLLMYMRIRASNRRQKRQKKQFVNST